MAVMGIVGWGHEHGKVDHCIVAGVCLVESAPAPRSGANSLAVACHRHEPCGGLEVAELFKFLALPVTALVLVLSSGVAARRLPLAEVQQQLSPDQRPLSWR